MFSMKCLSGLNNNMGLNMLSGSNLMKPLQSTFLLHDLRKSKLLNGPSADIYKCFLNYMKINHIDLNLNSETTNFLLSSLHQ